MNNLTYTVQTKEKFYFMLKLIFALIGYLLVFILISKLLTTKINEAIIPLLIYIPIILLFLFLRLGLLVGYLRGNSIKVTTNQFGDIHEIVDQQCKQLNIKNKPDVFIMQSGGLLNAFATRFIGNNYIILYSDIIEEAYNNSHESLEFIIGHELGHIKRKHMIKSVLLFPSFFVPFLNKAYSRACEYTCDNIGAALNSPGAHSGLLILASGKEIWKKVDTNAFMYQEQTEKSFWSWFAEKVSTHPKLTKRLLHLINTRAIDLTKTTNKPTKQQTEIKSDHSNYMPKV